MITNLALKGGGVKGIAYVGALHVLDQNNILEGIERVSGTSAGSIVAGMICAGYSVDQIEKLMHGMDFKKFETGWNPIRLFTRYGLYSGDYILQFIHKFMNESPKGLKPNATFKDMADAGCKKLYVFSTNLNTRLITEFSADETPDIIVAEAIRASMSIPLFFKAWQFSQGDEQGHIFVDGGVGFNYPLSFFDRPRFMDGNTGTNPDSIGFYLTSKEHPKLKFGFSNSLSYIKHLFESLMNAQEIDFFEDGDQVQRSVFIDDLGLSATDFNLSTQDMKNLVESGRQSAERYLKEVYNKPASS